jgi:hypothetical protein
MSAVEDRITGQSAPNQKNIDETMHRERLNGRRAQGYDPTEQSVV